VSETPLEIDEYLAALSLPNEAGDLRPPAHVYSTDGAGLYRIGADYYLLVQCINCDEHRGFDYLRKVMPEDWIAFHTDQNTEDGYRVTHFGPDYDGVATDAE
jgi:hypothetical protein